MLRNLRNSAPPRWVGVRVRQTDDWAVWQLADMHAGIRVHNHCRLVITPGTTSIRGIRCVKNPPVGSEIHDHGSVAALIGARLPDGHVLGAVGALLEIRAVVALPRFHVIARNHCTRRGKTPMMRTFPVDRLRAKRQGYQPVTVVKLDGLVVEEKRSYSRAPFAARSGLPRST